MSVYTDKAGNSHEISDEGLLIASKLKLELQKANNGKANWSKLCRDLRENGYDAVPCENFRMLVRRFQSKDGTLPPVEKYADMVLDDKLDSFREQIGEFNIQKREMQNASRELGKLSRQMADTVQLHDELLELAQQSITVEPLVTTKLGDNNGVFDNEAMVVVISDWHIGAIVDTAINNYNFNIAQNLLGQYLNKIEHQIAINKPREVMIVNLGDSIENATMRYNQSFSVEFDTSEQQVRAIKLTSNFVSAVVAVANNYGVEQTYYTGIMGNHDRVNGNKKDNIYGDGFTKVLNAMIEATSNALEGLTYIEPEDIHRTDIQIACHDKVVQMLFVHGDINNLTSPNVLAEASQFMGTHYDAIVGGHLHSAKISEQNGWIIQSGSLIGPTDYSDKLSKVASRSQEIILIDNDGNITPNIVSLTNN